MKSYQVERSFDLSPQFLIPIFLSPSNLSLVHSLVFLLHVIVGEGLYESTKVIFNSNQYVEYSVNVNGLPLGKL